jgi:hypothetical protein
MFGTQPADDGEYRLNVRSRGANKNKRPQCELVFTIEQLTMPTCQMSAELKTQIAQLKRMYKKIDNDFLENRIVPRLIVIVSESQHK